MAWSEVTFGKHRGKTLPQVVFSDPDWFFWAIEENVFKDKGTLAREAAKIDEMSRVIRIPRHEKGRFAAEYVVHPPTGKFARMDIVPTDRPPHEGSSPTFRKSVIDLSVPRSIASYDKFGCKILISCVKSALFGKGVRMTRQQCEAFFDSADNFDL
jgi:hypothetical protein